MQEPELAAHMVWEGMQIVEQPAGTEIPEQVLAASPRWISSDQLSQNQKEAYKEMEQVTEAAEFIYYWAKQGWMPELETEIED